MPQKLINNDQLDLLKEGDMLYRFPSRGLPETRFNESRKGEIDTYKIKSINRHEGILRLIVAAESLLVFTWPEDIERLDVTKSSILSEGIWWTAS